MKTPPTPEQEARLDELQRRALPPAKLKEREERQGLMDAYNQRIREAFPEADESILPQFRLTEGEGELRNRLDAEMYERLGYRQRPDGSYFKPGG